MSAPARFEVPSNLLRSVAREGNDRQREWIVRLPDVVAELAERWSLRVDAPFQPGGHTSWTAPARDSAGRDLVLKVGWAHFEAEHEAAGLRAWAGDGTVVVHEEHRDGETSALLLERARPGTELRATLPEEQQDVVVSGLLRRLWVEPEVGHPFRPLWQMCDAWADACEAEPSPDVDPGVVRAGAALLRSLPREPAPDVLLLTDLHAGNVLSALREPWLVIDPKPYVGDPSYDPVQHLLNCGDRLSADPHALVRRVAGLAEVDEQRLLLWLFARCAVESSWWPELAPLARRLVPG